MRRIHVALILAGIITPAQAPTPQATTTTIGTVQLAGDLGGTATVPTVLKVGNVTTGTLTVANGGTGATTLTSNGILYGNGTSAVQALATGTGVVHQVATFAPTVSAVALASDVSGTLAIGNGGTGITTSPTAGTVPYAVGSTTLGYSAAGTSGQYLLSGASGAPTWGGTEHDFGAYNSANLAAATALSRTKVTNASTLTADSTMTIDVVGVGAGPMVVKLCSDGTTCAGGNVYLTCTGPGTDCSAGQGPVGTITACVVTKAAVPAATVLTWSIGTACGTTDQGVNVNAHMTTP